MLLKDIRNSVRPWAPKGTKLRDLIASEPDSQLIHAIELVDSVHGFTGDRKITVSRVDQLPNGDYGKTRVPSDPDRPVEILVTYDAPTPALIFLHELGHYVDLQMLDGISLSNSEELRAWRKSVRRSEANMRVRWNVRTFIGDLREIRSQVFLTDDPEELNELRITAIRWLEWIRHLRYLGRRKEQFARSYTQYIACMSCDSSLLLDFENKFADDNYELVQDVWSPADFQGIAVALHELLYLKECITYEDVR